MDQGACGLKRTAKCKAETHEITKWKRYLLKLLNKDGFITVQKAAVWNDMYCTNGNLRQVRHFTPSRAPIQA